jgi:hypothetical protein
MHECRLPRGKKLREKSAFAMLHHLQAIFCADQCADRVCSICTPHLRSPSSLLGRVLLGRVPPSGGARAYIMLWQQLWRSFSSPNILTSLGLHLSQE